MAGRAHRRGSASHRRRVDGASAGVACDARCYDVTFDDHGNPNTEEVERAVQTVVMIRIRLCGPSNGIVA